ncbi:hypothetical protein V8J88_24300 [Massilia sp. W12]|uniref:tetratricopeptide repeat protein n=1 Tax=Massilia sp. W12 TaxID=3126507 RepID=UPI0030D2A816
MTVLRILLSASARLFLALALLSGCQKFEDEEHERNTLIGLFAHERYAALETALDETNQQYGQKTISAELWQKRWYAIANVNLGGATRRFNEWVTQTNSGYAYLLRGMYFQVEAWRRNDEEGVDEARRQAEFMRLMDLAAADLQAAQKAIDPCALCLAEQINLNRALGKPAEQSRALFEKAIALDPQLPATVFAYFATLYPPEGGSFQLMRDFINQMQARKLAPELLAGLESRYCHQEAQAAKEKQDFDSRLAWLQKGMTDKPYDGLARELASVYMDREEPLRAIEVLNLNLEKNNPWDLASIDILLRAYFKAGQRDKGDEMLKKRTEILLRYSSYR